MIVISNHVKTIGMSYPEGALIRINLAWIGHTDDVAKIINEAGNHKIWLDYPTGRSKPPAPNMSLMDAVGICKQFADHIEYFAFSNAEDVNIVEMIRVVVPSQTKLAPKIETKRGVHNIKRIIAAAKTDLIMLDKEDLYVDCDASPEEFNTYVGKAREACLQTGTICLELKGVIFSHD